jgi:ribosomal protein L20
LAPNAYSNPSSGSFNSPTNQQQYRYNKIINGLDLATALLEELVLDKIAPQDAT